MKGLAKKRQLTLILSCLGMFTGCSSESFEFLNPFNDHQAESEYGERSMRAILEDGGSSGGYEQARHALEVMGSFRRTQDPQPAYPVMQPAEARLMWIPDHLNKHGDLIPSHYYYIKILDDRWAVQDAFDYQAQLNSEDPSGNSESSATPYVLK